MDKCEKVAALYVASLKAMAIIHQHNHWTTKGDSFYEQHLLFERIYGSAQENLDTAAEKVMGIFGESPMEFTLQTDLLNKILSKYKNVASSPMELSMAIEKDFIKLSKDAYKCFEEEGRLTLGLDDMLMAISSEREGSVYLLQQSLQG